MLRTSVLSSCVVEATEVKWVVADSVDVPAKVVKSVVPCSVDGIAVLDFSVVKAVEDSLVCALLVLTIGEVVPANVEVASSDVS